jgi:hypothetical protein
LLELRSNGGYHASIAAQRVNALAAWVSDRSSTQREQVEMLYFLVGGSGRFLPSISILVEEHVAMHRKVALVIGAFVLIGCAQALADEVLLANLYGSGVHAFNRGDMKNAHADLSAAIQEGSTDPRAFYFRGLTYFAAGARTRGDCRFQKGIGV